MSNELTLLNAMEGSAPEDKVDQLISHFGMFANDILEGVMTKPEAVHIKNALKFKSVARDPSLWDADLSHKIDALSVFNQNYLPTEETIVWVLRLLAKMRRNIEVRSFLSKDHRLHYHWMPRILQGARFRPVPDAIAALRGTCCILSGPSGEGKSQLLRRLADSVPPAIELKGRAPAPKLMWVIPILRLSYPPCGTLKGLLLQMQSKFIAHVGDFDTPYEAFSDLLGDRATEAAVAYCTIFNVGILIIDGLSARAINSDLHAFANLMVHLKEYAGINIVLSGTDAFMHAAGLMGSTSNNMFDGPSHSLLPLPIPVRGKNGELSNNVMNQLGRWYWGHGTFDTEKHPPPTELVLWIAYLSARRADWFAKGYEAVLTEIARKPSLLDHKELTQEKVTSIFNANMRLQLPTRDIIRRAEMPKGTISDADFYPHIDRFKLNTLQSINRKWIQHSKMGVVWLA